MVRHRDGEEDRVIRHGNYENRALGVKLYLVVTEDKNDCLV